MTLVPRRIVDFGDDRLHVFVVRIKTVIKADRIHSVAEVPRLCE